MGTAILGVMTGRWIAQPKPLIERIAGLFSAGCLAMVAGLMWNWSFPINKNLWTSSYVVFTAGIGCATLATIMWLIDEHGIRWWTKPFVIYGMNPIVAVRWLRSSRAHHLHAVESAVQRAADSDGDGDLQVGVRAVHGAEECVARDGLRDCSILVRDILRSLPEKDLSEGLRQNNCAGGTVFRDGELL